MIRLDKEAYLFIAVLLIFTAAIIAGGDSSPGRYQDMTLRSMMLRAELSKERITHLLSLPRSPAVSIDSCAFVVDHEWFLVDSDYMRGVVCVWTKDGLLCHEAFNLKERGK